MIGYNDETSSRLEDCCALPKHFFERYNFLVDFHAQGLKNLRKVTVALAFDTRFHGCHKIANSFESDASISSLNKVLCQCLGIAHFAVFSKNVLQLLCGI